MLDWMAYLAWYYLVFLVGIFVFFAANDTWDNGDGGAGETAGRRHRRSEGPGFSDETLFGQIQINGCIKTCLYHVRRTQDLSFESEKLLRIVYPN